MDVIKLEKILEKEFPDLIIANIIVTRNSYKDTTDVKFTIKYEVNKAGDIPWT